MLKVKQWYLKLLEKEKKNLPEKLFSFFLYVLSLIYGFIGGLRNFFYDRGVFPSFRAEKKIISIGNLSWGGCGKTTLAIYLYDKLSPKFKPAVLRRGYGDDEGQMMKEREVKFYSALNRKSLVKEFSGQFDLFILDDGFQYRKLKRDLDIVVMTAREFRKKVRLIPAYFFRENLSALKRADILIINYKNEMSQVDKIQQNLKARFPRLKIYFANYRFKKITDLENNEYDSAFFKNKKLAALSAIGYPEGFFNNLKNLNLNVAHKITYPDHYSLTPDEFIALQENLEKEDISDIIITRKDKYHIPRPAAKLNVYVMDIEIQIEEEEKFLADVENILQT